MSALVCGKRSQSSFLEEEYLTPITASKRIRCSAAAAAAALQFSPPATAVREPPSYVSPIDHLRSLFPSMDRQLFERILEASGNDLDIAIKNLNDLCLESAETESDFADNKVNVGIEANIQPSTEGIMNRSGGKNQYVVFNLPSNGSEWVELIVREMLNSSNVDDARARASRVLELLEKSTVARAGAEATQSFQKENVMLKEQVGKLTQENAIWKQGFKSLHERKEEFDRCIQELQQMKEMMSQGQEQLRKLKSENYDLKLRLVREQQSSPIPGRFHPDIFG